MTVCQVCQKENPAGAEYCEDCGAALSAPAPVGAGVSGAGASPSSGATGPAASAPSAPVVPSAPTVPPSSSSSSAAASPAAPAQAESNGASAAPAPPTTPQTPATPATPGPASGTPGSQAQARLVAIRYGAPTGDEIPLLGQRLLVGRFDPETGPVDIDLSETPESGHISRQHGELYREGEGDWMVRDLGSTNGVFVKSGQDASFGPRITAPHPLQDGDEVTFGNARFIFKSS